MVPRLTGAAGRGVVVQGHPAPQYAGPDDETFFCVDVLTPATDLRAGDVQRGGEAWDLRVAIPDLRFKQSGDGHDSR